MLFKAIIDFIIIIIYIINSNNNNIGLNNILIGVGNNKKENRIDFENVDYYIGEIKDGKPHGKGVKYYKDWKKYEGDFIKGIREGNGITTFQNGDKYIGEFGNNVA